MFFSEDFLEIVFHGRGLERRVRGGEFSEIYSVTKVD